MPVYNGIGYIEKSLPPLARMMEKGEVEEVIVVDDSSTDESAQYASSLGIRVIPSGGRLGPGAARNMAARLASGNVLWFVDADVVIHDDAVRYIQDAFRVHDVVAIFGSYDEKPPASNFLSQYKNLIHHYYHHGGKREASTFWSGCGAVRKEAFNEAGGFDIELYKRPSIEDIELGYRMINAGGKIILNPKMQSTHLKEWRLLNLLHTEIFCRAIPWSRLMLKKTGIVNDLNVGKMEQLRAIVACLFFLFILLSVTLVTPWWVGVSGVVLVLGFNLQLFRFFQEKKGVLFALAGLLYHQLYYFYSTMSFAWCWFEHYALRK